MALPPEIREKFDEAFYLVNDRVDAEFNIKILSAENNPLLVTRTGMWPRVQSTYKEYLEKFSNELWEKIKKIIPDSPAINDFDWEKELKEYIIECRIHDYYLNAKVRFQKFKVPETAEWYDNKYQSVIDDLDYEIGATILAIKNRHPLKPREKEKREWTLTPMFWIALVGVIIAIISGWLAHLDSKQVNGVNTTNETNNVPANTNTTIVPTHIYNGQITQS